MAVWLKPAVTLEVDSLTVVVLDPVCVKYIANIIVKIAMPITIGIFLFIIFGIPPSTIYRQYHHY
jgi:hypothetical protein